MTKKLMALFIAIVMMLTMTACEDEETIPGKGSSSSVPGAVAKTTKRADVGCEITDYMYLETTDRLISENNLMYDEKTECYYDDYVTMVIDYDMVYSIYMNKPSNYSIFGLRVGDEFDREITSAKLRSNNFPLLTDEGTTIVYGYSDYEGSCIIVNLDVNNVITSIEYNAYGYGSNNEIESETISSTAVYDIYKELGDSLFTDTSFIGSFEPKALAFIRNNPSLFVGNDDNGNRYNYMSGTTFDYNKYMKSPDNYPVSIFEDEYFSVVEAYEFEWDTGVPFTSGILESGYSDQEVYYFMGIGSFDIYEGDMVGFAGLPIGTGSYETALGTYQKCIYVALCHIQANDYENMYESFYGYNNVY